MSDAIREAFEEWYISEYGTLGDGVKFHGKFGYPDIVVDTAWKSWQAALQQTAPAPRPVAVPEGVNFDLISAVLEDYASLQTSGDIPCANRYSASDVNEQAELLDMFAEASQPDHPPGVGRIVGAVRPFDIEFLRSGDFNSVQLTISHPDKAPANWTKLHEGSAAPSLPEGWLIRRVDDRITVQHPDVGGYCASADGEGESGIAETILYHFADSMLTSAPQPDHIADAGKVVPIGYLTNQAVARLQSDKRLNGEHLYAFKPDDLSKFQAVCLAPTVNESLTIEDFNGMCRIVEAVSQMTDGFAIDQCHMDRAREIVQDAARLRTADDEGDES